MDKEDRRIFERFLVELPVELRHSGAEEPGLGQCRDVSAAGLGVHSREELTPSINLKIRLFIPRRRTPFQANGRVVWTQQMRENSWRAGLELKEVDFMNLRKALSAITT